jgi:dTDP-4-dehydrorhamnose 3,5-epimerase-like enzyme
MADTEKADGAQWSGLGDAAAAALETRSYRKAALAERLAGSGAEAGELLARQGLESVWIPGVEIFRRTVYQQRHRGYFAELARGTEGILHEIGFWPRQWATALMFAGTAKGFHIHPPHIPGGEDPAQWMRRLFVQEPERYDLRPYDKEQWDVMFILHGISEMFLIDERVGMPRRKMRFFIEGDQMPGPNNVAVVIPPGVAHALRPASSGDLIMVYGTSTVFRPDFEGRIRSGIEQAFPPEDWQAWWDAS